MKADVSVSIVKSVQIRVVNTSADGRQYSWNKRFIKPGPAAQHWVDQRMVSWANKHFNEDELGAAYHRMTDADNLREERLSARLLQIATKKFAEMLA